MQTFRTILFWCHLASGVVAGLIILIMSATGVALTYEKQMLESANRRAYAISAPAGGAPVGVETLLEKARAAEGDLPSAVTVRSRADAPAEVSFGREKKLLANPYTGEILGPTPQGPQGFFRTMTDWHRWLAQEGEGRDTGKAITGASNLLFLFIVVSGIYLWWPRNKTRAVWRGILWFKSRRTAKARDFNWHNVIGFWCLLPLFFVVASATVISYPWASDLVYQAYGEKPPPPRRPGGGERRGGEAPAVPLAGLNLLMERAREQAPGWRAITMTVPEDSQAPVEFAIDSGSGGQPQLRGKLTLARGGEEAKWEPFASQSPARRMRSLLRFTHTGEAGGIVGQTIAGIASLGAVVLVWTGIALAWRRLRSWLDRRARREEVVPEDIESPQEARV